MHTSGKVNKKKPWKNRGRDGVTPAALPKIRPNVVGIDLGSREHCLCGSAKTDADTNVRVFGTTTPQLRELTRLLAGRRRGVGGSRSTVEFTYRKRRNSGGSRPRIGS